MKKKLFSACPFLSLFCLLLLVRHHFFVHSGFLWIIKIIKEKEGTFLYTHTRTERLIAEEKRERKKDNGEERGTRFVSIKQKRRSEEDFCKRDDEERSFFLTYRGTLFLRG